MKLKSAVKKFAMFPRQISCRQSIPASEIATENYNIKTQTDIQKPIVIALPATFPQNVTLILSPAKLQGNKETKESRKIPVRSREIRLPRAMSLRRRVRD